MNAHIYELGARVQMSLYGIKRQRSLYMKLDENSVGFVQAYKTPLKGVGRKRVRWLTGVPYPDYFEHIMLDTHIEPYGTPRK
jgi:hypothetical protein